MTFSIVACDTEEHTWGVAVASKFPAVGAVVPWAQADIGAVATQSFANTSFGPRGLALMGTGLSAQETLARLLEDDPDKELRQVGLVDAKGGSATNADVNPRRSTWSSQKAVMEVISTAGSITVWTIMRIPCHGSVNCSKCMICILAKARRVSA